MWQVSVFEFCFLCLFLGCEVTLFPPADVRMSSLILVLVQSSVTAARLPPKLSQADRASYLNFDFFFFFYLTHLYLHIQ